MFAVLLLAVVCNDLYVINNALQYMLDRDVMSDFYKSFL
jgi:hypothetical protein